MLACCRRRVLLPCLVGRTIEMREHEADPCEHEVDFESRR